MLFSAGLSAILAFLAVGQVSAREEQISVSDIKIQKVKSSSGDSLPKVSLTLNGARAHNQGCAGEYLPWPEPRGSFAGEDVPWPETRGSCPCGDTDYSFLLLPGEDGREFGIMIYHDVGDRLAVPDAGEGCSPLIIDDYRKADLRGWIDVDVECEKAESGEETCTQKGPIQKTIDGPVRDFFGGLFGDL